MSYILYINDNLIELSEASPIAQTKQVNNIASMDDRQTNFTNRFVVPPTPSNVRSMDKLYVVGNQSNIPYQKNTTNLFDAETGLCLIYKGWANITGSSDKGYEVYVYDGTIDIYKAIENKTLGDLDLSELEHSKTIEEIVGSFDNSKPYKYILADYNGKALYDNDKINIDYLVPSVKVSYVWDKIFEQFGFEYEGDVFSKPDFANWFLTYPKGTSDNLSVPITEFHCGPLDKSGWARYMVDSGDIVSSIATIIRETTPSWTGYGAFDEHFKALETKVFNLRITGKIQGMNGSTEIPVELVFVKNTLGVAASATPDVAILATGITSTTDIDISYDFYLSAGEVFNVKERNVGALLTHKLGDLTDLDITLSSYDSAEIDFGNELKNFQIKDFMNEVIQRFGLTIFPKKYSNKLVYKTIIEVINGNNAIDWTNKFISKEGEKYIYGSYAQNSWMRYKYNDDNANHNDGFLSIENKNLEDSKTIIQSKIFSPEVSFSSNIGFSSRVYKLWDKEPKDDGTTIYKALANRFYLIRSINKNFDSPVTIGSESLATSTIITSAPVESFARMKFAEIINLYYSHFNKILNKPSLVTCKLLLSNKDVNNIDFSVPYYFEQLGGNFIINKISNFIPRKETTVELVRVNDAQPVFTPTADYLGADYSNDYYI